MNTRTLQRSLCLCFLVCLTALSTSLHAQLSTKTKPYSFTHDLNDKTLPVTRMPEIDLAKVRAEDAADSQDGSTPCWRFAIPHLVRLNLKNAGHWQTLPNGDRLWRLQIDCPSAISVNLLYDDFYLPEGATLHLYRPDGQQLRGAFTSRNNTSDRKFATAILVGQSVVLEYYEPLAVKGKGSISIDRVNHGYRGYGESNVDLGDSGDCQVNINCPEGDDWQILKRSVAKYTVNGNAWCSGALVNNTAQDCRPLFLTANHCAEPVGLDAINSPNTVNTLVFYWNFERSGCSNTGLVDDTQTTVGASILANPLVGGAHSNSSDFALYLLSENPKDDYDVYFAGWDASGNTGTGGVGIHHPAGDAKKIATHNITPTSVESNRYWRIFWLATANGQSVTEGGSSGSPLFRANGRIIGQLFGSFSGTNPNCSDPDNDNGDYGRLDYSWINNGAADNRRRLNEHLDPVGLGATTFVDGSADPCAGACDVMMTAMATSNETCPNANDGSITIIATTSNGPLTYAISGPVNQSNGTGVFTNLPDGNYNITVTDTGAAACTATGSAVVGAGVDNTPPVPACITKAVVLSANGTYTFLASDVFNQAGSMDNCGTVNFVSANPAMVTCAQLNQTVPVTVTVNDGNGNTATCTAMITVQEGTTLPAGWSGNNVGNANGSAIYKPCTSNGQFTVTAMGFSTSSSDVLHLASRQLCGNGEIIAHLASVNNAGWGGITLRESLAQGSKMVALKAQTNGNIRRMIRTMTNGPVNNLNYSRPQHDWLRLTRNGSTFVGYTSMDGVNWTFAFSANVSMTGCLYAGLFAESINGNVTTTAIFDNVSITGATLPLGTPGTTLVETAAPDFQVYPNPTTGEVNLDLSSYVNRAVRLELYNVQGKALKVVEIEAVESNAERLDLSSYQSGLYLIRVKSQGLPDAAKRIVLHGAR